MKDYKNMHEFSLLSRNFILISLSGFLYFGSFYLLLPIIPQFVEVLGGTASQIGLVVGLFTMSSVVLRPYSGKLADVYGRKKMMIFGSASFALLFLIYAQIQDIVPLYFLRIIHGIVHGSYLAAAFAYVADLAPSNRRGEVMGVYGVANVVAMALFPACGISIVADGHNFSRLFFFSSLAAAASFLALLFIDEIKPEKARDQSVRILQVACRPAVLVASLTFFTAATAYGTVITFLPVYAPKQGISHFGIFFTTYAVFTLLSRVLAGKLSDNYGRRKVILPALGLLALAIFLLIFLKNVSLLIFIGACFGLGFGAFMPALNAFVVDRTAPHERSSALAFYTSFMDVGITAGALVLGICVEFLGFEAMYFIGGIIVCLGFVLFAFYADASSPSKDVSGKLSP